MRQLKIILTLTLALAFTSIQAQHNAIFNGGSNDGYATSRQSSQQNNSIFGGGLNDGYHAGRTATTTGNNVFNGGINDGYATTRFATSNNNSIFSGGVNDGYAKEGVPLASNNDIFTGGINDGYGLKRSATQSNNDIYSGGINDGYAVERSSEIVVDPALPIELLYFDAFRDGYEVMTQWETITEVNNDFFTVEKTKDSRNIVEVGTVPSQGNGTGNNFYELMDAEPFPGTSYYRLRQTDFDGTETWSDWVAVNFESQETDEIDFTVQPNPVLGEEFDIVVTGLTQSEKMEVRIYDMRGVLIHRESPDAGAVSRFRKTINPAVLLSAGMYVVEVSGSDYRLSRKLLVVR